jgi:hypothetical protein
MTRLATRLQPADARGRRRVRLQAGRSNVCSSAAGAARTLSLLDAAPRPSRPARLRARGSMQRRCLPAPSTERRRVAQEAHPHSGQRASCRCSLRAGRPPLSRWASCASLRQRRASVARAPCTPTSFFAWARTGARTAPEQGRHPRTPSAHWGGRSFASVPAPAWPARRPPATAPNSRSRRRLSDTSAASRRCIRAAAARARRAATR